MCTSQQKAILEAHFELLLRWNKKLNLTRITDPKEAWERHYMESIRLARQLPPGPLKIADVGSGAGFPGIPIAVVRPECQVTLIESHKRKAVFLREATRHMPNVRVLAMRAEDVKEKFDWVVSRAVRAGEVLKLKLAPHIALMGSHGEAKVFHVEQL